jgi:hypothetical protein
LLLESGLTEVLPRNLFGKTEYNPETYQPLIADVLAEIRTDNLPNNIVTYLRGVTIDGVLIGEWIY